VFMLLPLTPRRPLSLPLRWMKCSWRLLAWLLQAYPGAPGVLLAAPSLLLAAPGVSKAPGGSWPAPGGSWPPGLLLAAPGGSWPLPLVSPVLI